MGDPSAEVTEESRDASQAAKGQALEAISEGLQVLTLCLCVGFARVGFFNCSISCVD